MGSPSNIVVVTGTDTEIGKTLVTCAIARRLSRSGLDVRAVKPVESGIDELAPGDRDGVKLAEATGQTEPERALVELGRPLAPPEAAEIDGVDLDMEDWCRRIETIANEADLVLVEGAGGLLSPLTWSATARELAGRLGAPALVVAPDALGVLNHTTMALEVLAGADVPVLGVVFSRSRERDESTDRNPDTLRRFVSIERVAAVPKVEGWREAVDVVEKPANWVGGVVS